jgi:hypothetical protein
MGRREECDGVDEHELTMYLIVFRNGEIDLKSKLSVSAAQIT